MPSLLELSASLGLALQERGWQLALAESCTGGMIAQSITAIAGSSAWFDRGFVTYSNAAKMDMLAVPDMLIAEHGAVSEPVAQAMAAGALTHSLANISGAVTGIAGPGGGSAHKPVGTVCFAWASQQAGLFHVHVETRYFEGDRQQIREQAANYLLAGLLEMATQDFRNPLDVRN